MAGRSASKDRDLTIGRLGERTGCHIETIRYYERIGLLAPPLRTGGGHRIYGDRDVKRLNFVRRSRELGFTLDEIRTLLGLVDRGRYTCAEVRGVALRHLAQIRDKIADLRRLEKTLADTAARCTGGKVPSCPIVDTLFRPAK